jgi:autotransporter-associated beta strand protein
MPTTWLLSPPGSNNNYNDPNNWSLGAPGVSDTGYFGTSNVTGLAITNAADVGQWVFNPWASQYTVTVMDNVTLRFIGDGIVLNGGAITIDIGDDPSANGQTVSFFNNSSAGKATINNFFDLDFYNGSTAGNATINDHGVAFNFYDNSSAGHATINESGILNFNDYSRAGSAHIITTDASVIFRGNSTGGNARFFTDAGSVVDFSLSAGPNGNGRLTAGSLAGAGTYYLGGNQLTVGSNGLSTNVKGAIDDGGLSAGTGGSLVKVGKGTLKLSGADNTYSGGTTLERGSLDVAARGAAGSGHISFPGVAELMIENAALSAHVFANTLDGFGFNDIVDLPGLAFKTDASAVYHANHHLTVHSGAVTDTLTLLMPAGTSFRALNDGHGGTEVLLIHA